MATRHASQRVKTSRAYRAYVDLVDTTDWLRERLGRQLESFDLTMMEFRLLETLYHNGPQYQQALSRRFECSKQNIRRVLRILEEEGWIRSAPAALARTDADAVQGSVAVTAAEMSAEEARAGGKIPSGRVEEMKGFWKKSRPNMYEQLENSGKLHKAAVQAVVELRGYLANAEKQGQDGAAAMEAAKGELFFLRSERDEEKARRAGKQVARARSVPSDVVLRMKEHWRRFSRRRYEELERSGGLEREAIKAALQARDAYAKSFRLKGDEAAWEEVRKAYQFLPEGAKEQKGQSESRDLGVEDRDSRVGTSMETSGSGRQEAEMAAEVAAETGDRAAGKFGGESGEAGAENREWLASKSAGRPVVLWRLTPAGEELIADVFPKHAKMLKAQMRVLDGRQQQTLSRLCRKVRREGTVKFLKEMMWMDEEEE